MKWCSLQLLVVFVFINQENGVKNQLNFITWQIHFLTTNSTTCKQLSVQPTMGYEGLSTLALAPPPNSYYYYKLLFFFIFKIYELVFGAGPCCRY